MPTSFSTVRNRTPNSTRSVTTIINKIEVKPEPNNEVYCCGPYRFGSTQDRKEDLPSNRPLYMLLNLIDWIGLDKTIVFNRMRIYISEFGPANIMLQAVVYRLTSGATFGDNNTYQNNSVMVGSSSQQLILSNTDGPKADGLGFYNFVWDESISLPSCVDGVEQYYFVSILLVTSGGGIELLSQNSNWNVADLENYGYFDNDSTQVAIPTTMGKSTASPPGFFPYFTLYKTFGCGTI